MASLIIATNKARLRKKPRTIKKSIRIPSSSCHSSTQRLSDPRRQTMSLSQQLSVSKFSMISLKLSISKHVSTGELQIHWSKSWFLFFSRTKSWTKKRKIRAWKFSFRTSTKLWNSRMLDASNTSSSNRRSVIDLWWPSSSKSSTCKLWSTAISSMTTSCLTRGKNMKSLRVLKNTESD